MRSIPPARRNSEVREKVKLTNNDDLVSLRKGLIGKREVRTVVVDALIDSGASVLLMPQEIVQQLGLDIKEKVWVTLADNKRKKFPKTGTVELELQGRRDSFSCLVLPKGSTPLVGQIVLETLDFIVDCTTGTIKPAHKEGIVYSAM